MNIYFAIVNWGANQSEQLKTVLIGQALNSSRHTIDMRNLPQLTNRAAVSNNIIFHLIYREGQVIAKKEPLLMPQHYKQGHTVALDRNSYQGNIHHQIFPLIQLIRPTSLSFMLVTPQTSVAEPVSINI